MSLELYNTVDSFLFNVLVYFKFKCSRFDYVLVEYVSTIVDRLTSRTDVPFKLKNIKGDCFKVEEIAHILLSNSIAFTFNKVDFFKFWMQ